MRALDAAGNVDGSPATHTWNIADTIAPNTSISLNPTNPTTNTTANFQFAGTDNFSGAGSLTFQCRLDSTAPGDWAACTSPKQYLGLGGGSHKFEVRAVDQAGNLDATPATYTWTVQIADTTAPDTIIDNKPPLTTTDTNASFTFSATEGNVTYECKLDTGSFAACTNPKTYTALSIGQHAFEVRAKDAANNQDGSPARYVWTVQSPAPPANCGSLVTLNANADAWIDQGSTNANKGGDSILKVMSKSGGNLRALVRFLMPAMPAGCQIDTAALRLYSASPKDGRTIQALRIDDAWSEGSVTWGNAPATVGNAATVASGSEKGYREFNVASHVQAAYDANEQNGWLIRDANENQDSEQQFHSREKGSDVPQLVIRFKPASAPPPPPPADTTPPETNITVGPSDSTSSTTASFEFNSSETGSTFECRLDSDQASAWASCSSPKSYTGLVVGSHRFEVRAKDAAGNVDQSPSFDNWTITTAPVDNTAPQTTIDNGPTGTITATNATFQFSSSETPATFQCKLDNAAFSSCSSPLVLTGLSVGNHTFEVKATDAAGNQDTTPATRSWTIEAPPQVNCGSQVTASADADAWIMQGDQGKNNGSDSNLKVAAKSGNALRALVKFDLPTAPAGCVVDTATLRLYAGGAKDGRTIEARRIDGAWNEGGVNWSNQPSTAGTAATTGSGGSSGWREWSVAAMVQAMYSGSNHGFLIKDSDENGDAEQQYHSREKGSDTPAARRQVQARAVAPAPCRGRARPAPERYRRSSSSWSALKIASENVGYGWIVSSRVSSGTRARTASVSWPIHSPDSGPTATAPTTTPSFVSAATLSRPGRFGRSYVDSRPPSIRWISLTTWSPLVVPTDATCGSVNTAAGMAR